MSVAEAIAHLQAGSPQVAVPLIEAHLERHNDDIQAWFLLGACRHALNDLETAASAFSRSIALEPKNLEARLAYITVLRGTDDTPAALSACEDALVHFASQPRVHHAAAVLLEDLGRSGDALAHYERALTLDHGFEDALHNRGLLLARTGRLDDAEQNFRRYIEVHPESRRAYDGLVDVLLALGKYQEVLAWTDRLPADDASVLVRRGVALACLRRFAEAKETLGLARSRYPEATREFVARTASASDLDTMLSPENIFLSRGYTALGRCDWSGWDDYVAEMRRAAITPEVALEPAVAFMAQHLPVSGIERHGIARRIASHIESSVAPLPFPRPRAQPRIRVGILSPDYREHLNCYLLLPLFELLDRKRFELFAYSLSPDDGSAVRERLRATADCFRDLHALPDRDAALCIRQDDVDVLLDVGGHTTGGRYPIVAMRPARLQALYLGFAGSLGSHRVDFVILDRVVGCSASEWTERIVHLPSTYYLYDFRSAVPEIPISRADYGLTDEQFVYCAFHRPEKITPDTFDLWMTLLTRVRHSVLWFLSLNPDAVSNLRREAATRGVDPRRLLFAPYDTRERYLARHRLGDLMLDAIHHNAMTTACDALAAGLPVLSLKGSTMTSRAGESLLCAAGLPELVASDREAFVRTAIHLASDASALHDLKARVARNRHTASLFDTCGRVRELEAAIDQMIRDASGGTPL